MYYIRCLKSGKGFPYRNIIVCSSVEVDFFIVQLYFNATLIPTMTI